MSGRAYLIGDALLSARRPLPLLVELLGKPAAEALASTRRYRVYRLLDSDEYARQVGAILASVGIGVRSCEAEQLRLCLETGRVIVFAPCGDARLCDCGDTEYARAL